MRKVLVTALTILLPVGVQAYPIDGYEETGIRRLELYRLAQEGVLDRSKPYNGALLTTDQVDLRLTHDRDFVVPPPDPEFSRKIVQMLGDDADRYGIAVLDLTDLDNVRYGEYRSDFRQNVGSVGKMLGAVGLFQALADAFPNPADRVRVLRDTTVTADEFSHWDHHEVPFFDVETQALRKRQIRDGDQASLWEFLDWMLSPSSNSAAGMVMREAMMIRHFGDRYPVPIEEVNRYFADTPRNEKVALFQATFYEPLTRNGFDLEQIRQGSFFTARGKHLAPGAGNSYATARTLLQFAVQMEKGELIDEWSSRQLKRLLYMTERRIRYASAPRLRDAAVYFKSGSLYSCKQEEGFRCGKYKGNVKNYMNSFAIVEFPAGDRKLYYMVMLISDVLKVNSAVAHQTLATRIQRMLLEDHGIEP